LVTAAFREHQIALTPVPKMGVHRGMPSGDHRPAVYEKRARDGREEKGTGYGDWRAATALRGPGVAGSPCINREKEIAGGPGCRIGTRSMDRLAGPRALANALVDLRAGTQDVDRWPCRLGFGGGWEGGKDRAKGGCEQLVSFFLLRCDGTKKDRGLFIRTGGPSRMSSVGRQPEGVYQHDLGRALSKGKRPSARWDPSSRPSICVCASRPFGL